MADNEVTHGQVVLSAIIGGTGSVRALDYAWGKLTPDHFTDRAQRKIFQLVRKYADLTDGIPTPAALADKLRDQAPGSAQMYVEAYTAIAALQLPEYHAFKHSVNELRVLAASRLTEEALAQGLEILRHEVTDEHGIKLRGPADAREHVIAMFAAAEEAGGLSDSPSGDVTAEGDDLMAAYAKVKELRLGGKVPGVYFGIPSLDRFLDSGLGDGELGLIASGTTAGKSSLCIQCAWYNAVVCGKDVLIFTTEQLRTALRIKFIARHSRHPKFGLPRGLNTAAIRSGRLSEAEERVLAEVADDLKHGGYGVCNIVQMPETCTLEVMAAKEAALSRTLPKGKPDLVIADYLQLFQAVRPSRDARVNETQGSILKAAATWARSCHDGEGVPFLSPWQMNTAGVKTMKSNGAFTLEDLSETAEAQRTPGLVLSVANSEEDLSMGRRTPLRLTVLKFRDGPRGVEFPIEADYANCTFSDRADMAELDDLPV